VKPTVAFVLAVALAATSPAAAPGAERGQVGGPPTLRFDREPYSGKLSSKVIVVARARTSLGPVELVAYDTASGCLTIEVDVLRERSGSMTCHSDPAGGIIEAQGAGWDKRIKRGTGQFSVFLGGIAADVARVSAEGRAKRGRKRANAIIARPGPEILGRLNQAEPFHAWGVVLPGCFSGRRFTAKAFGADGSLLGSIHDPNEGGGFFPCK
jgi:hypothetical protein